MDDILTWPHVYNLYLRFEVKSLSLKPEYLSVAHNSTPTSTAMEKPSEFTTQNELNTQTIKSAERCQENHDNDVNVDDNNSNAFEKSDDYEDDKDDEDDEDDEYYEDDEDEEDDEEALAEFGMQSSYCKPVKDVATKYKENVIKELRLKLSEEGMEEWTSYKINSFSSFYKYRRILHRDISLQKLKEDMCDTCIKYATMLKDESIDESTKEKIKEALQVQVVFFKLL
jgi:hypothetical protein